MSKCQELIGATEVLIEVKFQSASQYITYKVFRARGEEWWDEAFTAKVFDPLPLGNLLAKVRDIKSEAVIPDEVIRQVIDSIYVETKGNIHSKASLAIVDEYNRLKAEANAQIVCEQES